MRILLEAHHPAHIHFWKYPVRELRDQGHEVLMIGRDRDVMRRLLEVYDWIPAEIPKRRTKNNRFPMVEMLERQWAVARAIRRFKPDVVASLMGSYTQSAKLLGVRNVIFTDSEFQRFNHRIAHPFADEIYTPECFYKDLGPKQRRYQGFHELMFLRTSYFSPNPRVLKRYGDLKEGGYIVIRLSAWNTLHDVGQRGLGDSFLKFIKQNCQRFRIVVSKEDAGQKEFSGVETICPAPEDFHDILYYSAFVLTEGASTASEAACLGVPAVYVNSTESRGYLSMLEAEFGAVRCFENGESGINFANHWLGRIGPVDWVQRDSLRRRIETMLPVGPEYVLKILNENF